MQTISPLNPARTWRFDAELLRRYDRPGPRYTSYPTAPHFAEGFGEADFSDLARRSNEDPIPRQLSLYVHIPYCQSPCFYCGCNRIITRDVARGRIYLDRLEREIALAAPLFDRDREVVQLHLGGGTPNFLAPELLGELVGSLGRHFSFSHAADRDFSIELDPRFVTPADIEVLSAIGFNRTSLGVQDFDPEVQKAINREQGIDETLAIIDACRRCGMRSVNVDLIYGLPRQTPEGFGRTLDTVIDARPDRLAIYGYGTCAPVRRSPVEDPTCPAPRASWRCWSLRCSGWATPATNTSAWTISRCPATNLRVPSARAACTAISWATPPMRRPTWWASA